MIKPSEQQYPASTLIDLLDPVSGALRVLKDEFSKQLASEVLKEVSSRLSTLADKDIKEMSKTVLERLFSTLESLRQAKDGPSSAGRESALSVIFGIAVQLIRSSYIQKKLLGLTVIKDMLPKLVRDRSLIEKTGLSLEWKDPKQLIKTLEDHKLVDIILGENAHAELLRKVEDLFAFLLANEKFEVRYLELMWKCCSEKHEDIMRTCHELLCGLVGRMSYPLLQELFKLVEATPCSSEILVSFLEKYTLNVLGLVKERDFKVGLGTKKGKSEAAAFRLYNLDLFWNLLLDQSTASGKIKDQAMGALIGILNKYTSMANTYVMKAAECIKAEQTVVRSVQLLFDIEFADLCVQTRDGRRESYYNLETMDQAYLILHNTLNDCEAYHSKVQKDLAGRSEQPKDLMNTDFATGFTLGKQAKLYIDFLEYYCARSGLALGKEDLRKLWKCYVEDSICEQHSDILFSSLMKEPKTSHYESKYMLLQDKVARAFFEEILCNPDPLAIARITQVGFACFKSYMLWANQKELSSPSSYNSKGVYDTASTDKLVLTNFQGLSTLWVIAFQSASPIIREQARDFLVNFIDKLCTKYKKRRAELTEKALETALDNVKDLEDIGQTRTALQITDSIIEKVECLKYDEFNPAYAYPPLVEVQVFSAGKTGPTVLKMNENMKLVHFRGLLSNLFKVHENRIVIKSYDRKTEFNEEYLFGNSKRLTDNKFFVEFKKIEVPLKETPRFILANSRIFARLQDLLKAPKEEIVNEVWKLILTLPVNETSKESLKKLAIPSSIDPAKRVLEWEKYLCVSPSYDSVSLTYNLHILSTLTQSEDKKQFCDKFLEKGGTTFLLSVFAKKKSAPRNKLNIKALEYCVKILSLYVNTETYGSLFVEGSETDANFWNGIKEIIEWISNSQSLDRDLDKESEAEVFTVCCDAHYAMLKAKEKFVAEVIQKQYLGGVLKECLLKSKNLEVQKRARDFLQKLLVEILRDSDKKKAVMDLLMLDFLKTALEVSDCSAPYFGLMADLIKKINDLDYPTLIKQNHIGFLVSQILTREIHERSTQEVDHCLGGMMDMLRLEMEKSEELRKEITSPLDLTKGLLSALFEVEKSDQKCKSAESREKAIRLLEVVLNCFPPVNEVVLRYLSGLHTSGNWRTNKKADWNISPGLGSRAGNFVGMKNLGATCYMNSSLQQLFMIPAFRKHVIEAQHKFSQNEENALFQLQLIFASLLSSQRAIYSAKAFTQVFKMDGRVLNVGEQKDVDEFLITLLDHVEQSLKDTTQSRLVKNLFKLTLANEIICRDCPHRSETKEEAISVILSVKNKKTIYEGLNAYVQADTLEGENAYYCERCDKKVAAYKRQSIKTLPNVLIIILKRFDFNVETMAKVKVNDYCEFPHDLDLEEFTQEGQTCKDLNKDLESGRVTLEDLSEDHRKLLQRKVPKYYYRYKLKGIIVHSGHADAGHYYSYIMDRENKEKDKAPRWLEFNDTEVRPFDPKDIPYETFGGEEDSAWGTVREKTRNAYVLVYERVVTMDAEMLEKYKEEEREVDPEEVRKRFDLMKLPEERVPGEEVKVPETLHKIIQQDNKKFWLTQYIFHPSYLSFVSGIVGKTRVLEDNNYVSAHEFLCQNSGSPTDPSEFAATFFLTTALRAENKAPIPGILQSLKDACIKNVRLSMWICKLFCHAEIIQEFLTDCPIDNVRRWVAGLLYSAMKSLYPLEKSALHKIAGKPANLIMAELFAKEVGLTLPTKGGAIEVRNEEHKLPYLMFMIKAMIQQMNGTSEHSFGQFFQVFCYFARLGPEARHYLNKCLMLGVALELLRDSKSKCFSYAMEHLVRVELKTAVPIGTMTKEHVYISKKAILSKKPQQQIFLFELVYRLINTAEIPKLKRVACDEDKAMASKFTENEQDYIWGLKEARTLDFLMLSCQDSKASLTFLSKVLAGLAFDNQDFTMTVFTYVCDKMAVAECNSLQLYFRLFYFLLDNKDRFANKAQAAIEKLHESFKKPPPCFRISECYVDFLIKMCRNNNVFLGALRQEGFKQGVELLDNMDRWLKDYPYLSDTFPVCLINNFRRETYSGRTKILRLLRNMRN